MEKSIAGVDRSVVCIMISILIVSESNTMPNVSGLRSGPEVFHVFLTNMNSLVKIKRWFASKLPAIERGSKGHSLQSAKSVALIYQHRTEGHFKEVRDLAQRMRHDFGLDRISRFTYVDAVRSDVPVWQMQKLESNFICKSDLNFMGKPEGEATLFCKEPFDLLINLEKELPLALMHVVRESHARMKVAVRQPDRNEDYDVLFEPNPTHTDTQRIQQILAFLSNTQLT